MLEYGLCRDSGGDIVSCSPEVSSINANTHAFAVLWQQVQHGVDLLEAIPERVARADIVLQQQHYFWRCFRQDTLNGLGDTCNSNFHTGTTMTPGMKDDISSTQQSATLQRPAQQGDGFIPDLI